MLPKWISALGRYSVVVSLLGCRGYHLEFADPVDAGRHEDGGLDASIRDRGASGAVAPVATSMVGTADAGASGASVARSQMSAMEASGVAGSGGTGGVSEAAGAGGMSEPATAVPRCGNGVREGSEVCDGADCPNACKGDPANPCSSAMLQGSAATCDARCLPTEITTCNSGDKCCPKGCNHGTDADCSPSCGDGVISGVETCEPGSKEHPCPALEDCDDGDVCSMDSVTGSAAGCSAQCAHARMSRPFVDCVDDDPCTDDTIVESTTACAYQCPHTRSEPTAAPNNCVDDDPCTDDTPVLSKTSCAYICPHARISARTSGDRCCPSGADATTDSDCGWCMQHQTAAGEQCLDFDDGTFGAWSPTGSAVVSKSRADSRPNSLDVGGGTLSWRAAVGSLQSVSLGAALSVAQTPSPPRAALCAVVDEGRNVTTACATVSQGALKLSWQHCGGGACGTPYECPVSYTVAPNSWTRVEFSASRAGLQLRAPVSASCEGSFAANPIAATAQLDGASVYFDNVTASISE
jgi:hypothetical protein